MSDQIRSISQNNYLLAAQQEVSHDNTLSGNGTEASPLGLNETVLWDGNGTAATTVNLSESVSNFERVRFYTDTAETTGVFVVEETTKGTLFEFSIQRINDTKTWIVMAYSQYVVSNNGQTLTGRCLVHMWFSADTFTRGGTGTNGVRLLKVVGINRKNSA